MQDTLNRYTYRLSQHTSPRKKKQYWLLQAENQPTTGTPEFAALYNAMKQAGGVWLYQKEGFAFYQQEKPHIGAGTVATPVIQPDNTPRRMPRLKLSAAQKERIRAVQPQNPFADTESATIREVKNILKSFVQQVNSVFQAYQAYEKEFRKAVEALANANAQHEQAEIQHVEEIYNQRRTEAETALHTAKTKLEAQKIVVDNTRSGKKAHATREHRKLKTVYDKAVKRLKTLETQKAERLMRLIKRYKLRGQITTVQQAAALPGHKTNKSVLSLARADEKRGADYSALKDTYQRYISLFGDLPSMHENTLALLKGAQEQFAKYQVTLAEQIVNESVTMCKPAIEATLERFGAIGFILQPTELAKMVSQTEAISLFQLHERTAAYVRALNRARAKRTEQRLSAFQQL